MSRLDALPADQRSVLQLLLQRGKGYDDLARMLRMRPDEVRFRAYDALDAIGPGARGLTADRRHEIADWLLGQQEPEEADRTRRLVLGSSTAGAWASAVARELEPLAGDRLPDIPTEAAATDGGAAASAAPRVSKRGGAVLIATAVVVVIAAALVIGIRPGKKDHTPLKVPTGTSTTASGDADVQAQADLTAPNGAPAKNAISIVQVALVNGQQKVNAVAQGLPDVDKNAYGIWAYTSASEAHLIGAFDRADSKGHIVYQGNLPSDITDISRYREILVTRETTSKPTKPGQIYLRGELQMAAAGG